MPVLLIPLTAKSLVLLALLLTSMLAHGLPILQLAIKISALVPSLLAILQLQVDVKSMGQVASHTMTVVCLEQVVLVMSNIRTQNDYACSVVKIKNISNYLKLSLSRFDLWRNILWEHYKLLFPLSIFLITNLIIKKLNVK